jgi:hypothetical protein
MDRPACKSFDILELPAAGEGEQLLEVIPGAELLLTYYSSAYTTVICCWDIRPSACCIVSQITAPKALPAHSICHTFYPSQGDNGQYIISFVALSSNRCVICSVYAMNDTLTRSSARDLELVILQLDYSNRESIVFEGLSLCKLLGATESLLSREMQLRVSSSVTKVQVFGVTVLEENIPILVFCGARLESMKHGEQAQSIKVKVWKCDPPAEFDKVGLSYLPVFEYN